MALLTAALSRENEPIFMLVYTVVAAVADLVDHRQDRVRKDRALRILLEEGVRALYGVAAARAVGRHLVRVAEGALEERHRHLLDDRRDHRPNERASAAEQVVPCLRREPEEFDVDLGGAVVAVPAAPQVM